MAQVLRPDSDITTTGWTTAPLFSKINETSADTTGASTIRNSNGVTTACEVGLSNPALTPSVGTCTLNVYATASGSGAAEKMTVAVYQGTSLIATPINGVNVTRTTYNLYSGTLDGSLISDYTNLRLRISMPTGGATEFITVSWAELQVPDAGRARRLVRTR